MGWTTPNVTAIFLKSVSCRPIIRNSTVGESALDERELLIGAYRDFNERLIDEVLARMHPDVLWANGMEGGHVHGREAVRAYWTRQWTVIDPHVEPLAISQ